MTQNLATAAPGIQDKSHDVLRSETRPLDALFKPASIAVIGATEREGSVGRAVVSNLHIPHFMAKLYPGKPTTSKHPRLGGVSLYL